MPTLTPKSNTTNIRMLSVLEAAKHLGIGRTSVYHLIKAGQIHTVHPVPGRTLIIESELDAYIDSMRS